MVAQGASAAAQLLASLPVWDTYQVADVLSVLCWAAGKFAGEVFCDANTGCTVDAIKHNPRTTEKTAAGSKEKFLFTWTPGGAISFTPNEKETKKDCTKYYKAAA